MAGFAGCSPEPMRRFEYSRVLMGVRTSVTLYSKDERVAYDNAAAAFDEIARIEDILTDYRANSEASKLTKATPGEWHAVSDDLWEVLDHSRWLFEASGGLFDPTVGPQVALWRRARKSGTLPSVEELDAAKAASGFGLVTLERGEVKLARPGMKLDFGGIGKGYAAQKAVELLNRRGTPIAMVALAGDVVAGEPPPGARGWIVAVDPEQPGAAVRRVLLRNRAISTSGDAEQFVEIGGVRYAHIVDPRTGLGATVRRSATVIAGAGWLADALGKPGVLSGVGGVGEVGDRGLIEDLAKRYHAAFLVTEAGGAGFVVDPFKLIEPAEAEPSNR